jgi:hypothetical protein
MGGCVSSTALTLDQRYTNDPDLLAFYKRKLLAVGWAGATDSVERQFIWRERRRLGRKQRGRPFEAGSARQSQHRAEINARG